MQIDAVEESKSNAEKQAPHLAIINRDIYAVRQQLVDLDDQA